MGRIILNDKDLKLAHELAELYRKIDRDPRLVSYGDKERLYGAAANKPGIHYKALDINRTRYRYERRQLG